MSSTRNTGALANQAPGGGSGEFQPRIQRDEPMTTSGHQPGKLVGNDAAPEFSAETLPAGTAPRSRTFAPNNDADLDPSAAGARSAADDITGASSADVHAGLGKPVQGQSSAELRDGRQERTGGHEGGKAQGQGSVDPRKPERMGQRALDDDEAVVGRGNVGGLPAQEREPETAESVAGERA